MKSRFLVGAAVLAVASAGVVMGIGNADAASAWAPPPANATFDYQIGAPYTPPAGVTVVSRDHDAAAAPGIYNICYVNAFQAQPDAEDEWGDLLLRDANGDIVYDEDWGEAILDTGTEAKRTGIAEKVGAWIDGCADRGFQAVEPDNYDSFTRAPDLIDADGNQALVRLLSARAHARGLAIAQKNTAELASRREANGLDFAVVEECGHHDGECGLYTEAFGDHVVVVEYTREGMDRACAGWADELSIVLRDVDVSTPDDEAYVYGTC
jgi:glycosyl hydrolase family 114